MSSPMRTVSEVGEITYTDGDAVGYETTLNAAPDAAEIPTMNIFRRRQHRGHNK